MVVKMFKVLAVLFYVWVNFPLFSGQSDNTGTTERVLSRRRRYLLFPEGASLQLVYDHTIPISYSQTIMVWGTTAAVAWMLPSDIDSIKSSFLYDKLTKKFNKNERVDKYKTKIKEKPIYDTEFYQPEKGYQQYKNPYVDYNNKYADFNRFQAYRPQFMQFNTPVRYQAIEKSPAYQQNIRRKAFYRPSQPIYQHDYRKPVLAVQPVTTYSNPMHNHYHRRTGRDLFGKIEKFIKAQRKDGRTCVLKIICEVNERNPEKKGTFTEEIIKAIFRFNKSHDGEFDIYDQAATGLMNCSETFPCDFSIWDVI